MKTPAAVLTGAAILTGAAVLTAAHADQPPAASTPDSGIWQKHQYSFQYMGFTSSYSCDGLADQLKRLLLAAGARQDVKSEPGACASPFGRPDKFARADLTFYTLAPAGAANTADKAKPARPRDAASPVGSAATAAEGPPVAGTWRPVAFTAHSPRELGLGDCELVEQFKSSLLPMFTTRHVDDHTTCIPHEFAGSVIDLKFESFVAAKTTPGVSPPKVSAATVK